MRSILSVLVAVLCASQLVAEEDQDLANLDKPVIGAQLLELDKAMPVIKKTGRDVTTRFGVVLYGVSKHGPAGKAGLSTLDIITHINKAPVKTVDEFKEAIRKMAAGTPVEFTGMSGSVSKAGKEFYKKGTLKISPVAKRQFVFDCLRTEKDEFKGSTFYHHKDSPRAFSEKNDVSLYIAQTKQGGPALRMQVCFVAKDWLFVRKYIFKAGEDTFTVTPGLQEVERDHNGGRIWEWYDVRVDDKLNEFLDKCFGPAQVSMRYDGDKYNHDREIGFDEAANMNVVRVAYKILKNESK